MLSAVFHLWSRVRHRTLPLRLAAEPEARQFSGEDVDAGIRWLDHPVELRGGSYAALFAHPDSLVRYRVRAADAERLTARCGLLPESWDRCAGVVAFDVDVLNESTGERAHATRHVQGGPGARQEWQTLALNLPSHGKHTNGAELVIELRTRVAHGSPANAWAIWGEPQLTSKRPLAELAALATTAVHRYGVAGAVARFRQYGETPDPQRAYPLWCARHTPDERALAQMAAQVAALEYRPVISVITPVWNTDPRWLRACVDSVRRQVYPHWELCIADDASESEATRRTLAELAASDSRIKVTRLSKNGHISAASNAALVMAGGEFVALLDHDDELTPDALFEMVRALNEDPTADFLYSDEDKLDLAGRRCDPYFKPDWSPEHFLTCMYTCHLMLVRKRLVDEIGGFRVGYEGAQDYDLVLRVMERTSRIGHVPKILYRWRKLPESAASARDAKPWAHESAKRALADHFARTGRRAQVLPGPASGSFRIRYAIEGTPLVSLIVPTRGDPDPLQACLHSLRRTRYPHFEVVVVADEPAVPEWVRRLEIADRIRWHALAQPQGFNFSEKINAGATVARGEHLLLLNDDTEIDDGEWLEAMLEYSQQPEIGAVGAKLLYPDGRLQHIGLVLGVCGVAAHAFHQHPGSSFGYASSAVSVRNYSAVSAACLLTPRAVFDEVGGFDPALPIDYNDVDYCLRVRAAGHRIVFTPYARLTHREQGSTGRRQPDRREETLLRARWGDAVDRDLYYNPNLTTAYPDYRLGE
jgi:GT2 family glycosyltransferase